MPLLVADTEAGAAEVLYDLARRWAATAADFGLVYLQLALYLSLISRWRYLSLADLYEQVKNPQLAIKISAFFMPQNSPLRRSSEIRWRSISTPSTRPTKPSSGCRNCSRSTGRHRRDHGAGGILRGRRFRRMRAGLQQGVATIANRAPGLARSSYFRGICNERAKAWAQAEADLREALKLYRSAARAELSRLFVDRPGASISRRHADPIRRAVEQRPDDCFGVDSRRISG